MNPGGWLLLGLLHGDAQIQADLRAQEALREAEYRRIVEEEAAQERHEELLEELRARHERKQAKKTAAAQRLQRTHYSGPWAEISQLGIPLSSSLSGEAKTLRTRIDPPNLLITGGTRADGRAIAERVQSTLGGGLREISLAGLTAGEVAEIAASLETADVWFVPSIEEVSIGAVAVLQMLQSASYQDPQTPALSSRNLWVAVGEGAEERDIVVGIVPFFIVAQSPRNLIPGPLTQWGGRIAARAKKADASSRGTRRPAAEWKLCPDCAEHVRPAARVCRYCRHEFGPATELSPESLPAEPSNASASLPKRRSPSSRRFSRRLAVSDIHDLLSSDFVPDEQPTLVAFRGPRGSHPSWVAHLNDLGLELNNEVIARLGAHAWRRAVASRGLRSSASGQTIYLPQDMEGLNKLLDLLQTEFIPAATSHP